LRRISLKTQCFERKFIVDNYTEHTARVVEVKKMSNKVTLLIMLGSLVLLSTARAYNPPIGIPAPSFGIDEVAPPSPGQWPSAEAPDYYYIDKSNANATDSGNAYGYPDKPRLTVPTATYSAGSYVEMRGGPYTRTLKLTFQCTQLAPCWLRGPSSVNMPIITGSINIRDSNYLIMENLDFNGGSRGAASAGSSGGNIAFRNSFIRNRSMVAQPTTTAFSITPALGKTLSNIVVYNNTFSDLGDWTRLDDLDFVGVSPGTWNRDSSTLLKNVWILENTFKRVSSAGIVVNAGNWTGSHNAIQNVYIGKNTGYTNREALVFVKQSKDVIISENTVYNQRAVGPQPGDGIATQYGPQNLWIIYNHIFDANYGIRQSDTSPPDDGHAHDFYIVGNVIHNIHALPGAQPDTSGWRPGQAIALWQGNLSRYIVDNTIYDVDGGITANFSGPLHMSGNLIYDISPNDYQIYVAHPARNGIASVDYSLFDSSNSDFRVWWNWQTYTDLTSFQQATGQCLNCVRGDPKFLNASANYTNPNNPVDLTIGSNSAAKGKNNDLNNTGNNTPDVYAKFQSLYGLDIRRDLNGMTRPMSGRSIGAYEASGSGGVTPSPVLVPLVAPVLNTPQVN